MHLIIANIPENFHSADLRNFFSEFIEKEAFNCFHFRHRPQSNLLNILKNSLHVLPGNPSQKNKVIGAKLKTSDGSCISNSVQIMQGSDCQTSHSKEVKDLWDKGEYNDRTDTTSSQARKSDSGCTLTGNRTGVLTHGINSCVEGKLSERREGAESENNATMDNNSKAKGEVEDYDDSRTHWLHSGLAGLASLITEKKRQVKPNDKWSHNAKDVVGGTSNEMKRLRNVVEGDSSKERNTTMDCIEKLSPLQQEKREGEASKRTCCVVDVKESLQETFILKYDRKHWLSRSGDILAQRCYLLRVDFKGFFPAHGDDAYKTREEVSGLGVVCGHPQDLLEFRPPPVMPQGNVGTPTHHFRELIRTCQMPSTLIKKLGLEFPRGRGKKLFGQVPFDYGTSVLAGQEGKEGQRETIAFTATGHLIPCSADFDEQEKRRRKERKKTTLTKRPQLELGKEGEDGAEVEEWERYEPFHEDVTSQDRIKERRFEEELEVVWEKGGSGLVFYTDAQFWRAQQGDFDEQTADEWDVDMSVYYEEGGGDKDARDSVAMIQSNKLRAGSVAPSVFARRKRDEETSIRGKRNKGRRRIGPSPPPTIGKFEAHTRGFGRRVMEAQGWQEGQGLGLGSAGMPYALQGDGQHPRDRKGFGYYGEKLQGWASTSTSTKTQRPPHRHHRISTSFDRVQDADPSAPPLRTPEHTTLSHRPR